MTSRTERRSGAAVTISLAMVIVTVLQEPGRIAPETKLDLAVEPLRFLGRALRLWQPEAAFGHIQNQAAGYLFPMGPFFALGDLLNVPMWAVQRAWMALILVVAFWGTVRVAEALGIGTPASRLVGGAAYALSPALVTLLAHSSGGQLPAAVAPWVLLPLIDGSRQGSPRRAAALSGVAVVCMGAVNATSTVGALALSAVWLLTRPSGSRRRALIGWWVLSVALASLWWVVALILQARYGLDFVPFTESASVTTATTAAVEVVRGMGHWLSYLFVDGPWLPGAWELTANRVAVAATILIAVGGIYGVSRRDIPERVFLVVAVVVGAVVVGAGYDGPLGGGISGPVQDVLDGGLAPVRNVAKFEPLLRLPLALGLAHAVRHLISADRVRRAESAGVALVLAAVLAAGAAPLTRGEAVVDGSFEEVPAYWQQAASWLGDRAGEGRTLLVPAAAFGEYTWGRPLDEPLQPLATSPWATRDLIPLGSLGATRLLDGIEARIALGQPPPGLAQVLRRSGIQYVLARNDLDARRTGAPAPVHVRRALSGVPGLRRVASFGPRVRSGLTTDRLAPDLAGADRFRALDVYRVDGDAGPAVVYGGPPVIVSGGPETLLQLADRNQLGASDLALAGDTGARSLGGATGVLSDALARRDVDFGAVRNNASYTLTTKELAPATRRAPRDRLPVEGVEHQAVVQMTGAATLRASSYGPLPIRQPEAQPFAAFDGDSSSAWVATPRASSRDQWIELTLDRPVRARALSVELLRDHPWRTRVTHLRVETDGGASTVALRDTEAPQAVPLPDGETRRIRLTIARVRGFSGAGFREITVPGVTVDRRLAAPTDQPDAPFWFAERLRSDPYDGTRDDEEPRLRRTMRVPARRTVAVSGTATPRPGPELDQLIAGTTTSPLQLVTSSTWGDLPAFAGAKLVDGDVDTAWLADPDDTTPSVQLSWPGPRTIDRIDVVPGPGPVLRPTRVRLISPDGRRDVRLPVSGPVEFPALTTASLSVDVVTTSDDVRSAQRGLVLAPPVGVAELRIPALADLLPAPVGRTAPIELPCGAGPSLSVDGKAVPTRVRTTVEALAALDPVPFTACDPVELGAGDHRIDGATSGALTVAGLTIGPARVADEPPPPERRAEVRSWEPERRSVVVTPGRPGVLAVAENFNKGWSARVDGQRLQPVRVDGWRQGWRLPANASGLVELEFGPGRLYRYGLLAGAVAVLVLLALAVVPARRATAPGDAGRGTLSPVAAVIVAAVVTFLLGGPLVVVVPALVLLARTRPEWTAGVAAAAYAAAGVVIVWHPGRLPGATEGAFGATAQALAVTALTLVVLALARTRASP
jgi:arabinofuranan 3-O-arabinosyltransferase